MSDIINQFAVQLLSPQGGESFNTGIVSITWTQADTNDPYLGLQSNVDIWASMYWARSYWYNDFWVIFSGNITYEIEYTEEYREQDTVWSTLKRRIPYTTTSYSWNVGKSLKTNKARVRIRTCLNEIDSTTEWSVSSGNFSINVFDLIAPAIVNPISNLIYSDFIIITLDESLTLNTYNQKVNYNLYYSSEKLEIDWTTIAEKVPPGLNSIRWQTDNLLASDDYCLKLLVKNSSTCQEATEENPDQLAASFVYNIAIHPSGTFLIDTQPPEVVLQLNNNITVTNERKQIVNIYSQDATTEVKEVQLRECNSNIVKMGKITTSPITPECQPIDELLKSANLSIGKSQGNISQILWEFDEKNGLRKLEALLKDSGGNPSISEPRRVFLPLIDTVDEITDMQIRVESRTNTTLKGEDVSYYEVAYLSTSSGNLWIIEDFPRFLYNIGSEIVKLGLLNQILYLFTYIDSTDVGRMYRYNGIDNTLIFTFPNMLSKVTSVAEYNYKLYIGLENGELWQYNGINMSLVNTFMRAISSLSGDSSLLYIGFSDNDVVTIYNGSTFVDCPI